MYNHHGSWRLALAALATLASAAAAQAQSSVTAFGVLDVGVQRITNGSRTLKLLSIDGLQTSRLGFRGTEDLGGGLSAGFHLEGALTPDTGGSGHDWRRRATVSLISKSAGELRLGRDYTPTFWNISRFNAFGTNGVGAASNLIYGFDGASGTASTIVRSSNSIGYFLPSGWGGMYGQAMVAAGEGSTGKFAGARLGYANSTVDVAGSYSTTDNNAARDKFKVYSLGGAVKLGDARLIGLYHVSEQTTRQQTNWVIGGTYLIGVTTLRASYVRSNFTNDVGAVNYAGNLLALGATHTLSKRTSLYATISRVENDKNARYLIPGGSAVTAGQSSRAAELGIYHAF